MRMLKRLLPALLGTTLVAMPASASQIHHVRVTYYVDRGPMADGSQTYYGAAACSTKWDFGTQFRFPDGRVVTCHDRGDLTDSHIDIWMPSVAVGRAQVALAYGDYAEVEQLNNNKEDEE